jgi:hypothetical protein
MVTEMIQNSRGGFSTRRAAASVDGKHARLLIGNTDRHMSEALSAFGKEALSDQRDVIIDVAGTSSELRALIARHHYDACILVLNNIRVNDVKVIDGNNVRVRIEHLLEIVEDLKLIHGTMVFTMAGWSGDFDLEEKVLSKGAAYYWDLPVVPRKLIAAMRTINLNRHVEEQLYLHWQTERKFQRRFALERSAEWMFRICELLIPPRVAREELGDAFEDIGALISRGCSRMKVWARILLAVVWALIHGLQYAIRHRAKRS